MMRDWTILQQYYTGFCITGPVGNNAFSYAQRVHRHIAVAPFAAGEITDLAIGAEPAFSEIQNGREVNAPELKQFLFFRQDGKDFFVFDNHNHAFFIWAAAFLQAQMPADGILVHIDQHTDWRDPAFYLDRAALDLPAAFQYTNSTLNVGNFIKPAIALGVFSRCEMITSADGFEKEFEYPVTLDIDLDIFSSEMAYIDEAHKINRIRDYIKRASLITIATSPFFMDQSKAIKIIGKLLADDENLC